MSARPFNPWAVPSDPFPPSLLGGMSEGEVRYVSVEDIHFTPPPLRVLWISRAAMATRAQTHHQLTAIELKDGIYWAWLSGRDHQLVADGEPSDPTVWAVALQVASEVTRPGVRPPADRPQQSHPIITDPRDPASTGMAPQYLVLMGATVDPTTEPGCEGDDSVPTDCPQEDPTVQIDASQVQQDAPAGHHGASTDHIHHDTGSGHSSHDAGGGGGGWADAGGGGGFSCGGGAGGF